MKDRIRLIMSVKNLSPADLADALQVQRSGISHILSGRNKPSLDFMLKVAEVFPDLSLDWLFKGQGPMLNSQIEAAKDAYKPHEREKLPLDLFSSDEKLLAEEALHRQIAEKVEETHGKEEEKPPVVTQKPEPIQENKPVDMLEDIAKTTENADKEATETEKEAKTQSFQPLEVDKSQIPVEKEMFPEMRTDTQSIKKEVVAWVAIYSDNTFKMYHRD